MGRPLTITAITVLMVVPLVAGQGSQAANESLWEASRAGDTTRITAALAAGADVNAKSRYDVTPLIFAAGNGRLDAVKLLLSRGAEVNAQDTFYRARAADMALVNGYAEVALYLVQNGSDADSALAAGVQGNDEAIVKAALAGKVTRQGLQSAMSMAGVMKREALIPIIKGVLDKLPAEAAAPAFVINPTTLPKYAGTYRDASSGLTMTVTVDGGALVSQVQGQPAVRLVPSAENVFRVAEMNATLTFNERGGLVESISLVQGPANLTLGRIAPEAAATPASAAAAAAPAPAVPTARPGGPRNWPSFRGEGGSGNGDGQRAVTEWDVASGKNIKWKTAIPGIANSSPVVWGDRVFAVTAISKAGDNTFKTGLYGDVKPVDDLSEHQWKIYSLDKSSGKIVWERTAVTAAPRTKRHTKSSQASSTPVTDGRRIVAVFGSAGVLIAWDFNGKELWRVDIGALDSGWFFDPAFQWGHSSSPIIYRDSVILQADVQKGSYIAAWDLATGKQLWKTPRTDEISTWGTPTISRTADGRDEIVTNGTKIRGYDPATGKQLWTLGPNSEITIGTPVVGNGLVFVTGGYPPVRPIYAIRPGAEGDISLPKGQESSQAIAWSNMNEGTYIPTPLVYGGYLFTLNINGVMTAYNPESGQRAFRGRVGTGGSFSASPIAADGKLYVASEDGEIYVLTAGPGLTQIAKNDMKEVIMATPAISDGVIVVRTLGHLYGIGQ
ncbi:MAG TPA: PQQ-binding-like beta-propeller repeat protein [Vicinamibacterales bacterium]|nr:PQQ-binding-like beta-propeller repeat protein [Vicinamibacterales bacterium]